MHKLQTNGRKEMSKTTRNETYVVNSKLRQAIDNYSIKVHKLYNEYKYEEIFPVISEACGVIYNSTKAGDYASIDLMYKFYCTLMQLGKYKEALNVLNLFNNAPVLKKSLLPLTSSDFESVKEFHNVSLEKLNMDKSLLPDELRNVNLFTVFISEQLNYYNQFFVLNIYTNYIIGGKNITLALQAITILNNLVQNIKKLDIKLDDKTQECLDSDLKICEFFKTLINVQDLLIYKNDETKFKKTLLKIDLNDYFQIDLPADIIKKMSQSEVKSFIENNIVYLLKSREQLFDEFCINELPKYTTLKITNAKAWFAHAHIFEFDKKSQYSKDPDNYAYIAASGAKHIKGAEVFTNMMYDFAMESFGKKVPLARMAIEHIDFSGKNSEKIGFDNKYLSLMVKDVFSNISLFGPDYKIAYKAEEALYAPKCLQSFLLNGKDIEVKALALASYIILQVNQYHNNKLDIGNLKEILRDNIKQIFLENPNDEIVKKLYNDLLEVNYRIIDEENKEAKLEQLINSTYKNALKNYLQFNYDDEEMQLILDHSNIKTGIVVKFAEESKTKEVDLNNNSSLGEKTEEASEKASDSADIQETKSLIDDIVGGGASSNNETSQNSSNDSVEDQAELSGEE